MNFMNMNSLNRLTISCPLTWNEKFLDIHVKSQDIECVNISNIFDFNQPQCESQYSKAAYFILSCILFYWYNLIKEIIIL